MNSIKQQHIEIWGLSLRLFHWLLVLAFFTAWWAEGRDIQIHLLAGTLIGGLLVYRMIWGIIGETHAQFSSFTPTVRSIKQHLADLLQLKARNDMGHTPIGSLMIFMLLLNLTVLTLSGFSLIALQMGIGLFSGLTASYAIEVFIQTTHAWSFDILQILIVIHLAGVLVESLLQRSNLVTAMFTGKKTLRKNESENL